MKSKQLLVVPHHIAKLASELVEFQWFLNEDDLTVSCDAIELRVTAEVSILLHELKESIELVDASLMEITAPGRFVRTSLITDLSELLKLNGVSLKKIKKLLDHHECSEHARKDAISLKEDYDFFDNELTKWLKNQQQNRFHGNDSDDAEGGSPVHACDLPERPTE